MGCRILCDTENDLACFYDSVTDTAFGPVVYGAGSETARDIAERFLESINYDPRVMDHDSLREDFDRFIANRPRVE